MINNKLLAAVRVSGSSFFRLLAGFFAAAFARAFSSFSNLLCSRASFSSRSRIFSSRWRRPFRLLLHLPLLRLGDVHGNDSGMSSGKFSSAAASTPNFDQMARS